MNSRANIIADIVHSVDPGISILSFDVTAKNVRCLEKGTITCLLCQRPEQQGFNAVRALVNKFLFNRVEPVFQYFTPVDIIIKENYPFYKDLFV
jgi:LacI family transcriptional regulator